jgi:hypothetical protein
MFASLLPVHCPLPLHLSLQRLAFFQHLYRLGPGNTGPSSLVENEVKAMLIVRGTQPLQHRKPWFPELLWPCVTGVWSGPL